MVNLMSFFHLLRNPSFILTLAHFFGKKNDLIFHVHVTVASLAYSQNAKNLFLHV